MIVVRLNGEEISITDHKLSTLLEQTGLQHKDGIAIAVNESVIPKSEWTAQILAPGDAVIIITATQGG
jgi:sulfur carrier protein